MLGLGTEHTYYYYLSAVDMRKGFNGLSGIVIDHIIPIWYQNTL